ncbi:MAG: hypothetical protein M1511_18230 [Deltaproteobacteria bacterium]|nr:hypothetical protein [Deltaproteobacteria bacterium]
MDERKTVCVTCAWRATCNKKFLMDGTTTTRCLDYTRDITLRDPDDSMQDTTINTKDQKNDRTR